MLFYGNSQCVHFVDARFFNISGMVEGYENLGALIPPNTIGHLVDKDFDIAYMNYIMSNDMVFASFFKIIHCLYVGQDVYLICDDADWSENLVESILKLIQQRYGYNGHHISSFEDYLYCKNGTEDSFNPEYGIANLDIDRDRYAMISKKWAMSANNPNIEGRFI